MKMSIIVLLFSVGLLCAGAYAANNNGSEIQVSSSNKNNQAEMNLEQGKDFLAKNSKLDGVVTLKDGLQYKIITAGNGPIPTKKDYVTVNYAGRLIDGTEFDSSYKRAAPITFSVTGVIRGWTEALQLMNVGSTWELYIPASLAYGERGAPPTIGSNETLIFKVELLSIEP
jgi:FKBP-type peptidyl-prolyl cis-trans isomerase FklB